MSFAVWVQWFENGQPVGIPEAAVERAFGAAVTKRDGSKWLLRHGKRDLCELHLRSGGAQEVLGLTLSHPCDAPAVWDAIHQVVSERRGVCYWPGGGVIARAEAKEHLPIEMRASLGALSVVANGANIAEAVAHS
jgi:hypothetical protein